MAKINLFIEKKPMELKKRLVKGEGEGLEMPGSWGFTDANEVDKHLEWVSHEILLHSTGSAI